MELRLTRTHVVLSCLIILFHSLHPHSPLYLPISVLMGVSSIQLSTSIVAGSPLLVVRILVDHTHLALSDVYQKPASLREGMCVRLAETSSCIELPVCGYHMYLVISPSLDYVCVLDLDWFELTLRLCNTAQFEEESQKVQYIVQLLMVTHIHVQVYTCTCSLM